MPDTTTDTETTTIVTIRHNGGSRQEIDLDQVLQRFLQDTLEQAEVGYWERRAYELEHWVRTPWGDQAAEACRARARIEAGEFDG